MFWTSRESRLAKAFLPLRLAALAVAWFRGIGQAFGNMPAAHGAGHAGKKGRACESEREKENGTVLEQWSVWVGNVCGRAGQAACVQVAPPRWPGREREGSASALS